jgi:hypothetical protein
LFCLSSLCILSLLLPVFLVLFVFTLYLESIIASVPCFVCLHSVSWVYYCKCSLFCLSSLCILSLLLPVFLVLFVFTVSWVYYFQCSLFCLSSLCILSLLLPVFLVLFVFTLYLESIIDRIIDSRYRVKTNKTRNTGNNRLKIQSEDKQNKAHWQ